MKEIIKELKKDYKYVELVDSIIFLGKMTTINFKNDGGIDLTGPDFILHDCDAKLSVSFFKDPFGYFEYRHDRMTSLIKYFYNYKKNKNITLKRVSNSHLTIDFIEDYQHKTCLIDFKTGKIRID